MENIIDINIFHNYLKKNYLLCIKKENINNTKISDIFKIY